jgi:hypothetical protein
MQELIASRVHSISAASVPALGIAAFFWKGDEALSPQFKQWLSERIQNLKISTPNIVTIEALERIFDQIYGRQYFAFSTFVRISIVTSVTFAIVMFLFFIAGSQQEGAVSNGLINYITTVLVNLAKDLKLIPMTVFLNIIFDFLSVTKARIIIHYIISKNIKYPEIVAIAADIPATIILIMVYIIVGFILFSVMTPHGLLLPEGFVIEMYGLICFVATTFITTIIIIIFCVTIIFLRAIHYISTVRSLRWLIPNNIISFLRWALPVEGLPVRSIGITAGLLSFLTALLITII